MADQGPGAPILADEGEEAVLDFVPLAGAGWPVADHDVEAQFVGQLLQFAFPQPHPRALLPPPSAVISNRVAFGYRAHPTLSRHWRMLLTAKAAVSWSTPPLTHPALAARSSTP